MKLVKHCLPAVLPAHAFFHNNSPADSRFSCVALRISVREQLLIAPLECWESCNTAVGILTNPAMCDTAHTGVKCLGTRVLQEGFCFHQPLTIITKGSN